MPERAVGEEGGGIGVEQRADRLVGASARATARDGPDRTVFGERGDALFEAVMDAGREHRRGLAATQGDARRIDEGIELGAVDREDEAGIGAELAGAHRQRLDERGRQRGTAGGERCGEEDHRVDARHLGIDRDRFGALRRDLHERQPTAARAGEADRLDPRIGDERAAEIVGLAGQIGEGAGGQAALGDRAGDRACDELAGAGMRRMALDDHRAARSERRRGVTTGDRESEREVRRAEHRDGAYRHIDAAQIGPRQRRTVGKRGVDRRVEPVALADDGREQPQLSDGTATLAFDPRAGQAAFLDGAVDQFVTDGDDRIGDRLEEGRARFGIGRRIFGEGRFGERGGIGHGIGAGRGEIGGEGRAGRRVDPRKSRRRLPLLGTDQNRSVDHRYCSLN